MRALVTLGALALGALPLTAQAATPEPAANDAACTYDSLSPQERERLGAQTFAQMMRGADQEADAPLSQTERQLAGARTACQQRFGWSASLTGLSHEYAALSLARDAFRRMMTDQGASADAIEAYHRRHRAEFGRDLTPAQQAAFTSELTATKWGAADESDSAIDVAVGYLGMLVQLDRCQRGFAVALASSQAKPVQTAAR